MARIELDHVCLTFHVRRHRQVSLKELLLRRLFRPTDNPVMEVPALKDVTLQVGEGERLGIIGHNGAGKSTLLRLLAGIYPPTSGRCFVEGRVSSLFELASGFEQDANGWDNIAFRGYLHGETPASIHAKRREIAEFSELGEFLNMPVRYYSSGMRVRLAFAIATAIEPEILLVDEVFGAGDLAFQEKARRRMLDMMAKARLIVMVSHALESVCRFCTRAVWMDHGAVREIGPADEVARAYAATAKSARKKKKHKMKKVA